MSLDKKLCATGRVYGKYGVRENRDCNESVLASLMQNNVKTNDVNERAPTAMHGSK